jgi:hypothetical protein
MPCQKGDSLLSGRSIGVEVWSESKPHLFNKLTSQSIIVWTLETKFLLLSPAYGGQALQKGGIPLFGKEGLGEISSTICLLNYGFLSKYVPWMG